MLRGTPSILQLLKPKTSEVKTPSAATMSSPSVQSKYIPSSRGKGKKQFDYGPFGLTRAKKVVKCCTFGGKRSSPPSPAGHKSAQEPAKKRLNLGPPQKDGLRLGEKGVALGVGGSSKSRKRRDAELLQPLKNETAEAQGKTNHGLSVGGWKGKEECSAGPAKAQVGFKENCPIKKEKSASVQGGITLKRTWEGFEVSDTSRKKERKVTKETKNGTGDGLFRIWVKSAVDPADEGLQYTLTHFTTFRLVYDNYAATIHVWPQRIMLKKGDVNVPPHATPAMANVVDGDILTSHGKCMHYNVCGSV